MKTKTVAAIDIGSNSLKLVIVKAAASNSFTVVLQERERIRLGQETLRTHQLSEAAINLSAEAIGKFRSIAESREADQIIAVATASVREAENAQVFVSEIEKRTGVCVEILSSLEEARLIGVAASQSVCADECSLLNIDIGGGSTEISLMNQGEPHQLFSTKLGAVGLTEKFISSNPPKLGELKKMRTEIALALAKPGKKINSESWQISTGTSGTILIFASLLNPATAAGEIKNPSISLKKLAALNEKLAKMNIEERAKLPGISPPRAEVIIAGGQILEGVMRSLKIETVHPCAFALREGVIIDYLRRVEAESLPPVPDVEDNRLRGVFAVGRRYGYEENHALHTAYLAERIFDELALVYEFERHWRALLSAAALLHDVGYHISHESHHKHSLYLIKHSEMTGFSEAEKLLIANIARYHRGSPPKDKHTDFMSLSEKDRQIVWQLGAILRLAEALDRGYENQVKDVKLKQDKKVLMLKLVGDKNYEAELQAVETKKDMFETAFGCQLKAI